MKKVKINPKLSGMLGTIYFPTETIHYTMDMVLPEDIRHVFSQNNFMYFVQTSGGKTTLDQLSVIMCMPTLAMKLLPLKKGELTNAHS
jgi:hypothetical protein